MARMSMFGWLRSGSIALLAALLGLALRLALAIQPSFNFDVQSYSIVAAIARHGGNVYAETNRYNYSPVWMALLFLLSFSPLPFHVAVRAFVSVVDVLNGLVVRRLLGSDWAVVYWLSPVAILITGYHGQFDTLAALPLLVAMTFRDANGSGLPKWTAWLQGTISVMVKQLLLFGVWVLFVYRYGTRRALLLMAATGGIFLLSFVPYVAGGLDGIIHNVLLYRPVIPGVGMGMLPAAISYPVFVGAMVCLPWLATWLRLSEPEAVGLSALALITFIPGMGVQYWQIVALFGLALAPKAPLWIAAFSITATVALGLFYGVLPYSQVRPFLTPSMNAVWLVCLLWLAWIVARAWRTRDLTYTNTIKGAIQG